MTGTIRNQDSRPCFARVNPEKETKRRRQGVSIDCEEWVVRVSAGRRGIDYLHGHHHGHVPQVRGRQRRGAKSGSTRRDRRRDRRETRASKMASLVDTRPLDELMREDEECFEGWVDRFRNEWSDYHDTGLGIWPPLTDEELGLPNRGVLRMNEDLKWGAVWTPLTDEEFGSYHREESEMIELARNVGCNI